jgi:ComF family protein
MKIIRVCFRVFQYLRDLLYPPLCVGCSEALVEGERFFCSTCLADLPKTGYHLCAENRAYERLSRRFLVQRAAAYVYYNKKGLGKKLVAAIKYRGNLALGEWASTGMAREFLASGFFEGIDCLIPVPLHEKRLRARGFNQSEVLAQGISAVTGIPIEKNGIYRVRHNVSQTTKGILERWENTRDLFQVRDAELLNNKHVLLIDDVLTTGSTAEACAQALLQCKNTRVSVLTLAAT